MAKLIITREGQTRRGDSCYYLDHPEDPYTNCYGERSREPGHFAGFFWTENEAREWAAKNDHEVEDAQ